MKSVLKLAVLSIRPIYTVICAIGLFFVAAERPAEASTLGATLGAMDCVVYPSAQANVGSSVPGVLLSIPVDRSDTIEKGQILAVLESSAEQAAVKLARARAEASSEVKFRLISAEHSDRQSKRIEELHRGNSISNQDLDNRKTEARLSQVQLDQALESKNILELELARAKALLDRRTIRSPFNGVVLERFSSAGEYVDDQPVVRIAQLDPLHVETIIPGEHLRDISTGMTARVWSETAPDEIWTARVDRVDPVIDVASGTFGVRLLLPNADQTIVAGLRCKLEFSDVVAPTANGQPAQKPRPEQASAPPARLTEPSLGAALPAQDVTRMGDSSSALAHKKTADDSAVAAPAGLSQACVEPGPYPDAQSVFNALEHLTYDSALLKYIKQTTNQQIGHLVMSVPLSSRDQADSYLTELELLGITDFKLLKNQTPLKVSFGAFKNAALAEALLSSLTEKNLQAEILPWKKNKVEYFLTAKEGSETGVVLCD